MVLHLKNFLIPKLCLLATLGHPLMTIASPFNLVCKSQATEIIVPLSIDLDRRAASVELRKMKLLPLSRIDSLCGRKSINTERAQRVALFRLRHLCLTGLTGN